MMKKKQVVVDVALNVVATAFPLCVLQLFVLPLMAQYLGSDEYGLVVTTLSIFNVLPSVLGIALNNIRLIFQGKYEEQKVCGDFNIILCSFGLVCSAICVLLIYLYGISDPASLLLFFFASLAWIMREYYLVAFRLKIDYRSILICNVFQACGYLIGYGIFLVIHQWILVYFVGQCISLAYILSKTDLHLEPFRITNNFRRTALNVCSLTASQFLSKFMAYSDRILLYPAIGGSLVSVYYVSTLVGKIASMAVNPLNGVMLSYLSKKRGSDRPKRMFYITMLSALAVCVLAFFVIMALGRFVLGFLYAAYVDEALTYLPVTSITALLYVMISVAQPFTLKYYSMRWQIVINGITCFIYVTLGMFLLDLYGLMGFCVGALIANVAKLFFMLAMYLFLRPDSGSL